MKLQLALHLLLLVILQLHCLPPPSPHLQSVTLPACSLNASPRLPAVALYYCAFQGMYYKIKNTLFFLGFIFMYYLCEKYYKPTTVQYYIVNCVSWVPRLTLLDLQTNWSYECTLRMELDHVYKTYCTYLCIPLA